MEGRTARTALYGVLYDFFPFSYFFRTYCCCANTLMAREWFRDFEVTPQDIDEWHQLEGKFCSGCVEGKLREHARKSSTKPLSATRPGENGAGTM